MLDAQPQKAPGPKHDKPDGTPYHLISRKKDLYPVSDFFESYLVRYGRIKKQGIRYTDLSRHYEAVPLYNEEGEDTHWATVFYKPYEQREIHQNLLVTYALLKADGDLTAVKDLYVDRVDLCLYGNTLPYRVRIVNALNENFDYFYVKRTDANRIYGLELEHILSPSRIHYFIKDKTIIEEHIIGIPGDVFIRDDLPPNRFDRVRLAKQFVKFDVRCFVRLLGDMHAGNFVVDVRRDFEKHHYLIRSIDFDQQSHHWRRQVYNPQDFPQNVRFVNVVQEYLAPGNIVQYQKEERALIENRVRVSHGRFDALMDVMREDIVSNEGYVIRLREQLAEHYEDEQFERCMTMGDLVYTSIQYLMDHDDPPTPSLRSLVDWLD